MLDHFIHFEIGVGCRAHRPLKRHGEGKRERLVAHETCRRVTLGWLHGMESWGRQTQSGRRGAWTIMQGMEIVACGACGDNSRAVHVASRHHAEMLQISPLQPAHDSRTTHHGVCLCCIQVYV